MLLFVFFIFIFVFNKKICGYYFCGFTFVFLPYVIITFINNYFWKNDFYPITNVAIEILCLAMIVYEVGLLLYYGAFGNKVIKNATNRHLYSTHGLKINYQFVELFIIIVIIFRLFSVLYVYFTGGLAAISKNNFASLDLGIIGGRLIICLYPAGWIIAMRLFGDPNINRKDKIKKGKKYLIKKQDFQ